MGGGRSLTDGWCGSGWRWVSGLVVGGDDGGGEDGAHGGGGSGCRTPLNELSHPTQPLAGHSSPTDHSSCHYAPCTVAQQASRVAPLPRPLLAACTLPQGTLAWRALLGFACALLCVALVCFPPGCCDSALCGSALPCFGLARLMFALLCSALLHREACGPANLTRSANCARMIGCLLRALLALASTCQPPAVQ